jgi:hypothetical protein
MLSGALQVTNFETGKSQIYMAGEFFAEAIGQWHKGAHIGTGLPSLW